MLWGKKVRDLEALLKSGERERERERDGVMNQEGVEIDNDKS